MSDKNKRQKELENEIKKLQKRLNHLRGDDEERVVIIRSSDDEDDVDFVRPLPPLPPTKPLPPLPPSAKPVRRDPRNVRVVRPTHETRALSSEERARIKKEKERIAKERQNIKEELHNLKDDLNKKQREFDAYRRELRAKEQDIREKERLLRERKYTTSYSFDVDTDEDIERMTTDLEVRLGEYTRSILSSVADSLKSSMGVAIKNAGDIGTELKGVGKDLKKFGKEIGDQFAKEVNVTFGPTIPDDKLEEFYEIGANIVSAIGDSNRLRILKELESGPMYQKELSEITNLRGGTFKHHMDKLMEPTVKFVTQEVVRGRYLLTTRGREALKLAEIQFIRYLEEDDKPAKESDDDKEFNVKVK